MMEKQNTFIEVLFGSRICAGANNDTRLHVPLLFEELEVPLFFVRANNNRGGEVRNENGQTCCHCKWRQQ